MKSIICNKLSGELKANPSKSHFIRLILIAWIYGVELEVINPCNADDCITTIEFLKKFGCKISKKDNSLLFNPKKLQADNVKINCGESATLLRMLSAILPIIGINSELTGIDSLLKRDFSDVVENSINLGLSVQTNQNKLPIKLNGRINTNQLIINASHSSQFLSGLLIALPKSKFNEIQANNLVSKGYVDLTLDTLYKFGTEIENINYKNYILKKVNSPKSLSINCEADWSGTSYWIVAGAISGEIIIKEMDLNSKQPDKAIVDILKNIGANIKIKDNTLRIKRNKLTPFNFNAVNNPDLIPALIPLALSCQGKSEITGVDRLINKESNRLKALLNEFNKLGANINYQDGKLLIENSKLQGCEVKSYNDHRIAMSLITSSIICNGELKIDNVECINKSYPNFLNDFKSLGGIVYE